jgi:hypothetical protein
MMAQIVGDRSGSELANGVPEVGDTLMQGHGALSMPMVWQR